MLPVTRGKHFGYIFQQSVKEDALDGVVRKLVSAEDGRCIMHVY